MTGQRQEVRRVCRGQLDTVKGDRQCERQRERDAARAEDFFRQLVIGGLAPAELPVRWGSTLGMHAELRGVVYLTPPTSRPSTSCNLSKPALPAGPCPSNVTAGGQRCVCVCVCVLSVKCMHLWDQSMFGVDMSLPQLCTRVLKGAP